MRKQRQETKLTSHHVVCRQTNHERSTNLLTETRPRKRFSQTHETKHI